LPSQRKLPDKAEQEAQGMLGLKVNKKLLQNHLRNFSGKIVTLSDITNNYASQAKYLQQWK